MGKTFQSGIISRLVIGGGTYAVLHGETQIDVDSSNGLPTIIKLQPIDPSLGQCTVYINDYGNNCSVGNITIMASGGNLINGQPTLVLDTDGIGAEISVADQKSFIASLNNDSQSGGGTITGAFNGLSVSGTNIILGGALTMPTTIDALGSNTFSINDQAGLMFKTRDALGNFFFNNIGGTGTLVGSSQYIFSYLGDGGNVFTDSLIVINFGGANNFTQAVDFWNFGDYTQANLSSSIFNIGRFNHFDNVSSTTVMGYSNDLNAVYGSTVLGSGNTYSGLNQKFILGNNNNNLIIDGVTGILNSNATYNNTSFAPLNNIVGVDMNGDFYNTGLNASAVLTGAGLPNYVSKWTSGSDLTISQLFDNGTNVGINTITPSAKLHLKGIDATSLNYTLKVDNSASMPLLYVRNDGNVGIGTSNPTQKLHILSSATGGVLAQLNDSMFDVSLSGSVGQLRFSYGSNIEFMMNPYPSAFNTSFRFKSNPSGASGENGIEHSVLGTIASNGGLVIGEALNVGSNGTFNGVVWGKVIRKSGFVNPNATFYPLLVLDGNVGIGTITPSAKLHTQGIDSTSLNYALKIDNSATTPLFYVRNDGFSNFNNGDLTIQTVSNVSILDVANYKSFKISMTGSYGDFIKLSNTVGDISLYKYTTIGGVANPSSNCTLEIGSAFSVSSLGVKNIAFVSSASGLGMMAIGSQGSASIYGTPMQRFTYDPVSFGGIITDLNNNYHRVGFGVDPVVTHRVIIADGLKISTGGINAISLPVGNAGLASGDLYVDTSANILANGDLVVGRKV